MTMRGIFGLTAGLVVFAASAAGAQVTGIVTTRSASYDIQYEANSSITSVTNATYNGEVPSQNKQISGAESNYPSVSNYQVSTTVDNAAGYIAFSNNVTSAGFVSSVSTTTSIQVNYKNPTASTIDPVLNSTITPAGFGVYVGSLVNNPTMKGLTVGGAPVVGDVNQTPEATDSTFLSFPTDNNVASQAPTASVSFQILSGSTVLASYSATLTVYQHSSDSSVPVGEVDPVLTTSFSTPLADFGLIGADDPTKAVGYSWDATPIVVALGDIAPHSTASLTYATTVSTSQVEANQTGGDALITYAGFGDPIGKNVGAKGISDPNFAQLELGLPSFQVDPLTGDVTLTAATFSGAYIPALPLKSANLSPVPEPEAWALLLGGLGIVGARFRRRPSPQAA